MQADLLFDSVYSKVIQSSSPGLKFNNNLFASPSVLDLAAGYVVFREKQQLNTQVGWNIRFIDLGWLALYVGSKS